MALALSILSEIFLPIYSNIFGYTGKGARRQLKHVREKKKQKIHSIKMHYIPHQQSDIFKLNILLQNFSQDTELKT